MSASEQASLANASFRGLGNMMVSGQEFFSPKNDTTMEQRVAITAAFAFDHLGPDVDPAYKDRQSYKIEIIWRLNKGINGLNGQQLSIDDMDGGHPVWYPETMNKRIPIPENKFRLLFAEGEALKPSKDYTLIPGLTSQTVVALFPFGIPAPRLLDTLSNEVKREGVYFDCRVDVTHVPTGKVLLKEHNLASGFNGVRVVSSDAPEAVALGAKKPLERSKMPTVLYYRFFFKAVELSDKQLRDWKLEQLSDSPGAQLPDRPRTPPTGPSRS